MSSPATEILLRMVEMFVSGELSHVGRTVTDEYIDHQGLGQGPLRGPAGFAQVVAAARGSITELQVAVEDSISEEDRVAARLRWRGKAHDGTSVERESFEIIRVRDGLAVEHWGCSAPAPAAATS